MLKKLLKIFDIYGSQFNLRINGQSKFKSAAGGIFSMVTIGILLITIIYFGKNFYRRLNPKLTVEEGLYRNSEIPILEGEDYDTRFVIISFEKFYDSIMKLYTYQYVLSPQNEIIGFEEFFFPECPTELLLNNSIVSSLSDEYLQKNSFKCIKLNDFKIGGDTDDNPHKLVIETQMCSEIDEKYLLKYNITNCDKNFNKTVDMMYLNIWYEKIGFSPNSNFPFTKKNVPTTHFLSKDKINMLKLPISVYHLNDDLGWIFNSTQTSFTFNFMNYNFIQYPSFGDITFPRLAFFIYVSEDYKVFTRTYEKIQDLLAVIGGFMKIVFAFINLLNLLIKAYLLDNYMVGRIFDQGESVNVSHYKNFTGFQNINEIKSAGKKVNNFSLDPQIRSRQDKSLSSRLFFPISKRGMHNFNSLYRKRKIARETSRN
jgi:hypothetical protein